MEKDIHAMYVFNGKEEMLMWRLNKLRFLTVYKVETVCYPLSNHYFGARYHFFAWKWVAKMVECLLDALPKDELTKMKYQRFLDYDEAREDELVKTVLWDAFA